MFIIFIQLCLFLSLCTTNNAAEFNSKSRAIVRSMLDKNNEKLNNWDITTPIRTARTPIEPLPNIFLHRSIIRASHMQDVALDSNRDAQNLFGAKSIQRISDSARTKDQRWSDAFELLDLTLNLKTPADNNRDKLVKLRDEIAQSDPVVSCIIRTILYLQAQTDGHRHIRLDFLNNYDCKDNPEIKDVCQFLINYGDAALSAEDVTKKFVQRIMSQKRIANLLAHIAQMSIVSHVINKLTQAPLKNSDKLITDYHYILAELCYHTKKYDQAKTFYIKNTPSCLKKKNINNHAFTAYIASTDEFCKKDIAYLSSLVDNLNVQLKAVEKTDQQLSHGVALLTDVLITTNNMDTTEKIKLLLNGLDHLQYAQKNAELTSQFHILLSMLYEEKKDYDTALYHLRQGLKNDALLSLLDNAQHHNPEMIYTPWIKAILKYINNQDNRVSHKDYRLLPQFAASELCAQLLPYCQQAYATHKKINHDIFHLMAVVYKNKQEYSTAYHYISKLSESSPAALLLKANLSLLTQQTLSDKELETIFTSFTENEKPSSDEQTIILSLVKPSADFFIENYELALALITTFARLQNVPPIILHLAYYVENHLIKTKSSYYKQWEKGLNKCKFYDKIKDSSQYDGDTNAQIGCILQQKNPIPYKQIVAHLTTALDSNTLLPETTKSIHSLCGALHCDWANSIQQDKIEYIRLLNIAINDYQNSEARYRKALYILQYCDKEKDIERALKLLEQNITENSPQKELSQLALAHAYLNYHADPARIPVMQQHIPLDIDKALLCLEPHNNNAILLNRLINILSVTGFNHIDPAIKAKHVNIEKALEYLAILINSDPNNTVTYLIHRMYLYAKRAADIEHAKVDDYKKAIDHIDLILDKEDISNSYDVTRERLLHFKLDFLLKGTIDNDTQDQLLETLTQLKKYNAQAFITFNQLPALQEYTHQLITNKDTSDKAIEWCCCAADAYIAADVLNSDSDFITPESAIKRENLIYYLFGAADMGNLNAQLTLLLYYNAIHYKNDINHFTQALCYTHQALRSLNSATMILHKAKIALLIDLLRQFTEEGIAIPYYILCDYYKNDPQQLKAIMQLFSKKECQQHYLEGTTDTVKNIVTSCKDTLQVYVDRFLKNPKKGSLVDALATFTLASMYHYTNQQELLTAGTFYFNKLLENSVFTKFKLPQYPLTMNMLLGYGYYQNALLTKHDPAAYLELLKKSASCNFMSATHLIAEHYIEQTKNGIGDGLSITSNDFLPALKQDIDLNKSNNPKSIELYQKYLALQTNNDTNIVKHLISENPPLLESAFASLKQGNPMQSVKLVEESARKDHHPTACMLVAHNYLLGDGAARSYSISRTFLVDALSYGVLDKQFYDPVFIEALCGYIKSLLTKPHPRLAQQQLISIIKTKIKEKNIDEKKFYEICKTKTDIDLSSHSEWQTPAEKKSLIKISTMLKKSLFKDDVKQCTFDAFIAALETLSEPGCTWENIKNIATQHPPATSMKIAYALMGKVSKKNYDLSKKLLVYALAHGIDQAKFCNEPFLDDLYAYIEIVITQPEHVEVKHPLLATIRQALEVHKINLTTFHSVFKDIAGIDLSQIPEWSTYEKEKKVAKEETEPIERMYAKNPQAVMDMVKKLAIEKNMIKHVHYKEHSQLVMQAGIYSIQNDKKNAIAGFKKAMDRERHPCAAITFALNNLDSDDAEQTLRKALDYGLLSKSPKNTIKQFHSAPFLHGLILTVEALIITHDDTYEGKSAKLLSVIKTVLTENGINTADFCEIYQKINGTDLLQTPGWAIPKKHEIKKDIELSAAGIEKLTDCTQKTVLLIQEASKKNMLKDINHQKVSHNFQTALEHHACGNKKEAATYFYKAAHKEQNPCAYMALAVSHLTGNMTEINYETSEQLLKKAFEYGLVSSHNNHPSKQFLNIHFLNYLFMCLEALINKNHPAPIKASLLALIKTTLVDNKINLIDFEDLVKIYNINLSFVPEWVTKKEKMIVINPSSQEHPLYLEAVKAGTAGDMEKFFGLIYDGAVKEHNPTCCMCMVAHHCTNKEYTQAKDFLLDGLKNGIISQKFYSHYFLSSLCTSIEALIVQDHDPIEKKKLLTIIRKALDENKINLPVFYEIFQTYRFKKDIIIDFARVPGLA